MKHQKLPTETIKIRVIHRREFVGAQALNIVKIMQASGYRLVSRSRVYPSHPPQLGDGIVHLEFEVVSARVNTVDTAVDTPQDVQLELPLTTD